MKTNLAIWYTFLHIKFHEEIKLIRVFQTEKSKVGK